MFNKVSVFIAFFIINSSAIAGDLDDYVSNVKNRCPGINSLIIKKSLIQLTNGESCNSSFTALLLKDCSPLSCSDLITYWSVLNNSKSGAIIGK